MTKKKTKRLVIKTALGISLVAGVSFYPLMRHIVNSETADFDKNFTVIDGDSISKQQFYENVQLGRGGWRLVLKNGKIVDVDQVADFRHEDAKRHQVLQNLTLKNTVDTVRVRYAQGSKKLYQSDIVYGMGAKDSLGYIPSFGMYNYGELNLRYFKADSQELQKIVDFFNDKYNCTHRHEYQHYLNALAGINRAGQSYETKFVECCLDEVSGNIAQLLAQRKNYLENGRDASYITARFKFYADSLKSGKIKPQPGVYTPQEIKLIADGVFDAWMKKKFNIYIKNNTGRTVNILKTTNYNGIQPNDARHQELMKACFLIDGIDFYPYIAKREKEIREKIPNEKLKIFRYLKKEKFKQMTYVDELEQKRIEKGNLGYNVTIVKNKAMAQMRHMFGNRRQR